MKCIHSLCAGLMMLFSGCCSAKVEDYADNKPALDIREYFNGHSEAWGTFIDRSNKADPSFYAQMKGSWHGDDGTFEEHFDYSDGRKQERIWNIHFTDEHHFTATAHDVIGVAKGAQYGNAMNMRYVLAVTTKAGKTYNVSMDDWLYLMEGGIVINRAQMSKFGFHIGELAATFRRKQ